MHNIVSLRTLLQAGSVSVVIMMLRVLQAWKELGNGADAATIANMTKDGRNRFAFSYAGLNEFIGFSIGVALFKSFASHEGALKKKRLSLVCKSGSIAMWRSWCVYRCWSRYRVKSMRQGTGAPL